MNTKELMEETEQGAPTEPETQCSEILKEMTWEEFFEVIVGGRRRGAMIRALEQAHRPNQAPAEPVQAVAWMNARHFVVSEGGSVCVMTEELDPVLNRRVLQRSSFEDIKRFYCNQWVTISDKSGNPKSVELGKFWLSAEHRRQYRGIVCAPSGLAADYYNLWKGFSVEPRQGDWSLMEEHIRTNICNGNEELYRYVRRWLAFAVQNPGTLPEVALVLRGKQGTGKGIFARAFGSLFGQHFLHLARSRNLVGNFNSHLRDAIVVFADEAFLADDKQAEGVLKSMITEPELTIEAKFRDLVLCRNLIHLIIASNNDRIINAAAEERRFCMLDVGEKHMQDVEYFRAIANQMNSGGREAMLYDLLHEDLRHFDSRRFPATSALLDQKIQSMNATEVWWLKRLQRGWLLTEADPWPTEVLRDDLLRDYRDSTGNRDTEGQELRNALGKLVPEGYPQPGSRPTVDGHRKRTWLLPSLTACRDYFAQLFKMDGCWDGD